MIIAPLPFLIYAGIVIGACIIQRILLGFVVKESVRRKELWVTGLKLVTAILMTILVARSVYSEELYSYFSYMELTTDSGVFVLTTGTFIILMSDINSGESRGWFTKPTNTLGTIASFLLLMLAILCTYLGALGAINPPEADRCSAKNLITRLLPEMVVYECRLGYLILGVILPTVVLFIRDRLDFAAAVVCNRRHAASNAIESGDQR